MSSRIKFRTAIAAVLPCCTLGMAAAAEPSDNWRQLPLITGGRLDRGWSHVGYGGFTVDGDSLRTECDPRELGLLVYTKEKFDNCQIRVVFKSKEPKSNAGLFVRIADGVLDQLSTPGAAFDRKHQ